MFIASPRRSGPGKRGQRDVIDDAIDSPEFQISTMTWAIPQKLPLELPLDAWGWGSPAKLTTGVDKILSMTLNLQSEAKIEKLMSQIGAGDDQLASALVCLAMGYHLPPWGMLADASLWPPIADMLNGIAEDSHALCASERTLERQWLHAELPTLLSVAFPKSTRAKTWIEQAREAIGVTLRTVADDDGIPMSSHWSELIPIMASLVRCQRLARDKAPVWAGEIKTTSKRFFSQIAKLHLGQGRFASASDTNPVSKPLLTALALSGIKPALAVSLGQSIAVAKTPRQATRKTSKTAKKGQAVQPIEPSFQSDEAYCAWLRTRWDKSATSFCLRWHEQTLEGELRIGNELVAAGEWAQKLTIDGRELQPIDDWDSTCYVADDDVVYVEVEQQFEHDWRVQRQFCLAKSDGFLLFADAVLGDTQAAIQYEYVLPLAHGIRFGAETESHEGWLKCGKQKWLTMPLALPEWRLGSRHGECKLTEAGLSVSISAQGIGAYSPLWIDTKHRSGEPFTWRHLTVAENRRTLSKDYAAGYRIQIARRQYLLYRSLLLIGNRTVLGHNTVSEFVLGKFLKTGQIEPLLEIE